MTAQIHPGDVVHTMDHLVLDLTGPRGARAYFTVYSLGFMLDVGSGRVALLRIERDGVVLDRCYGETIGLALRMQQRLRSIRAFGGPAPAAGIDHAPIQASIRRTPAAGHGEQWQVESSDSVITASWSDPEPAFFVDAPAPAFHPSRDYVTTLVGYGRAELVVDGERTTGSPYPHTEWERRLGRPLSSCHIAMAETAIEAR